MIGNYFSWERQTQIKYTTVLIIEPVLSRLLWKRLFLGSMWKAKLRLDFSMLALVCSSYRDDINLRCWAPLSSPQARHCNRGLYASSPLLVSLTLSILWVCFLLYLLTLLNKPRRRAQAAIVLSAAPHTLGLMLPSKDLRTVGAA